MPPLLVDFIHARACKPFCENSLTLPSQDGLGGVSFSLICSCAIYSYQKLPNLHFLKINCKYKQIRREIG